MQKDFALHYDPSTLAFVVISTPAMFEEAFKPFISKQCYTGAHDPIDECIKFYFHKVRQVTYYDTFNIIYIVSELFYLRWSIIFLITWWFMFNPQWYRYVVFLSKSLYLYCFSRLI